MFKLYHNPFDAKNQIGDIRMSMPMSLIGDIAKHTLLVSNSNISKNY